MRQRFATLAATCALALTLGAAPALAGSQSNGHSGWVVYGGSSDEVTGFELQCGSSSYTAVSGTIDSVWQRTGTLDSNFMATTNGHAIETWTANDVVAQLADGSTYPVLFMRRMEGTYRAGSYPEAEGPFMSFSWIEHLEIVGTSHGYSLVLDLHHQRFSGTCDVLPN